MFVFTALCAVLLVAIKEASTASYITPCPTRDKSCVERVTNSVYQQLMKGIPELGIAPNEPALLAAVDADIAGLKYQFRNAKVSGFDKCKLNNFRFNVTTLKIQLQQSCPRIVIEGPYETVGTLMMVPVHGKGNSLTVTGLYNFEYDCSAKVSDCHGRRALSIRSCRVTTDAVDPLSFDVDGLFGGNQRLSDLFHDLMHDNWKPIHDLLKAPIWEATTKHFINCANKILCTVPAEELTEGW